MVGTRIPDVRRDRRAGWSKWDRVRAGVRELVAPAGSYMRVRNEDGSVWCWYIRDPTGDASSIRFDHHAVTEFADGTISVSPSIVVRHGHRWHGFLERGVWRSV